MKILFNILFFILISFNSFSQTNLPIADWIREFELNYNNFNQLICKGDTATILINRAYGGLIYPPDMGYLNSKGVEGIVLFDCTTPPYPPNCIIRTEVPIVITGGDIISKSIINENTLIVKVKPNQKTTYNISFESKVTYDPHVFAFGYEILSEIRKYSGSFIIYVANSQKPSITSNKSWGYPNDLITITNSTPCENSAPDLPNSFAWTQWKEVDCNSNSNSWASYNRPFTFNLQRSGSYIARCNDNGCLSDTSSKVGIILKSRNLNCDNPSIIEIDSIENNGQTDYHHYTDEFEICRKTNPNCTLSTVCNLMLSSKIYNVPVAFDFPETLPCIIGDCENHIDIDSKIPILASKLLFPSDTSPVSNCTKVNLPGATSMTLSLLSYLKFGNPVINALKNIDDATGFGINPIMQTLNGNCSVTNYTLPTHLLYPGKVERTVMEDCDKVYILSVGSGNSWASSLGLGNFFKNVNINAGQQLFHNVNQRLKNEFIRLYGQ